MKIQMSVMEIAVIESHIRSMPDNGLMVEWGSGMSTIQWLSTLKPTQNLMSIEHSKEWHTTVHRACIDKWGCAPNNFQYCLESNIYPRVDFKDKYGTPFEELPCGWDHYIHPNDNAMGADIFLIDGIVRGACLADILVNIAKKPTVSPSPVIFLHDYIDREGWYSWAVRSCTSFEVVGESLIKMTP